MVFREGTRSLSTNPSRQDVKQDTVKFEAVLLLMACLSEDHGSFLDGVRLGSLVDGIPRSCWKYINSSVLALLFRNPSLYHRLQFVNRLISDSICENYLE